MKNSDLNQEHPDLVTLCTFNSEPEALLAQSMLATAGIPSILREDSGVLRSPLTMTQGVTLLVKSQDAPDAQAILSSGQSETS